ncbi:MAG: CheY-like chemotaxis protein [Rhodothermales bacterium]|jgi:CheY-like chemotaxis protein
MPNGIPQHPREELNRLGDEIRTALNGVMGVAGLLAATPLDPDQTDYLQTIRSGGDDILGLIERLVQVSKPTSPTALASVSAHAARGAAQNLRNGRRLLLVEDNLINRRVIMRLLENLGHTVHTACDGREACEAIKNQDFDLVFMDIQMPIMDGLQATRFIREHIQKDRQPWVVALTAVVLPEDKSDCMDAGADDFLSKPVRADHLQEAIRRAEAGERRAARTSPGGGALAGHQAHRHAVFRSPH